MTVKERLIKYIKSKGMSTREFCRHIGVSETYVNSMRSSMQPDKLIKITHLFPDLNAEWLLTGDGEMLKNNSMLPPISRDTLVDTSSEIFKDKLIEMFKGGEIFSATLVWEQHRQLIEKSDKIESLLREIEKLKIKLAQNGIKIE